MADRPPLPPDIPSLSSGGIYIRWRDRLWQEQPDGSYLVWEEESHQWQTSTLQPPGEEGKAVATRECANCKKRVKVSLRSCPYCGQGFEAPAPEKKRLPAPVTKSPTRATRTHLSPASLVVALVLTAVIAAGVFLKARSDSCDNWKEGITSYTRLAIASKGLPRGLTAEEFNELNEDRFADTRPGGCE